MGLLAALGKLALGLAAAAVLAAILAELAGPTPKVRGLARPDTVPGPEAPPGPGEIEAWLAAREGAVPDLRPAAAKRIVWAGEAGRPTAVALVYLHGYSASAAEMDPLPQAVAAALGANLFLTRLTGHGRDGAAMAEASVPAWRADALEALQVGGAIGGRVVLMGSSTGATLAVMAALDPEIGAEARRRLAALVLLSPNMRVAGMAGRLLEWPWIRHWGPWLIGRQRGFTPIDAAHAEHWTERYPTRALAPLGALTAHARGLEAGAAEVPALVLISPQDRVIATAAARDLAARWGAPARLVEVALGPGDDPARHVLAGDILSPGQTRPMTRRIADWLATMLEGR